MVDGTDDFKNWDISPKTHKGFRYDRKCDTIERKIRKAKAVVLFFINPYRLESKELQELNLSDIEKFESKWVEPILSIVASHVNMISSECFVQPSKVRFWLFLENLSKNIEIVMTKGVNIVLMGVHIEYNLKRKPRLFPNHFALNVYCPTIPTRVGKKL